MDASRRLGLLDRTNGLVMLLMALVAVLATVSVFRPQRPSSFSTGSGFGVGFGSESIMVGASSKAGAAR